MTEIDTRRLRQRLADLHAERVATWDPAALQVNINQRATILAQAARGYFVQCGDETLDFDVREVDGATLRLDALLADGPLVLDLGNALGREFGILYGFDEASRRAALARGKPVGDVTGTGTWELPMPAVIVIDQRRVVRFVDVSPDWVVRTEAPEVLAQVRALGHAPAALFA